MLKDLRVICGAARVPYCDTVCDDGLYRAPIETVEALWCELSFLQVPKEVESLETFFGHRCGVH